jgi:hypothetical protein
MTNEMREWSVLITAEQSASQPAISDERMRRLLELLGAEDAWVQYPPASGRGHGFETRWWQRGEDSLGVAASAIERYREATRTLELDTHIVLVHVATPEDRLNETVIGLESRLGPESERTGWNVMLRAIAGPDSTKSFPRSSLRRLLERLPGDGMSGFARDGLVEVRFWTEGTDAVDASRRGTRQFTSSLHALGFRDWIIVRAHVTSVAEARRTAYLGVEQRIRAMESNALPVDVR